jgi:surface polysaccharide O-acyltransferase-like enzyme
MDRAFLSKSTMKLKQSHEYSVVNPNHISDNNELLNFIRSNYVLIIKIFIIILSITALSFGCEKDKKENKMSIKYQKNVLGGCYANVKKISENQKDTIIFSIVNDTLNLHYGIHYSCCGKLINTVKTNENKITIEVADTSANGCLCKCLCYYSSDFKFTNFQTGTYTYKVLIKNCINIDFKVFKEGSVYVIKQ